VTVSDDPRPEQLRELLELQRTDAQIRRLRHQLDDLPEQQQLDEVEARATELTRRHDAIRVDLDRVGAEQRRLEGEVDLLRQRKDAEHARMYSGDISSPKELQSLRAEIDSTERRIADHEDELLEVMERRETLDTAAEAITAEHGELEQRMQELEAARDAAAQGLLAELAELQVVREKQRSAVDDDYLTRYDDKLDQLGGVAVGELQDGMCTACRIELPYAEVNELLDGPPLATCPQCRRLLVIA
jgi:predicted  nucleic acid-binding Zn-ribbon protein